MKLTIKIEGLTGEFSQDVGMFSSERVQRPKEPLELTIENEDPQLAVDAAAMVMESATGLIPKDQLQANTESADAVQKQQKLEKLLVECQSERKASKRAMDDALLSKERFVSKANERLDLAQDGVRLIGELQSMLAGSDIRWPRGLRGAIRDHVLRVEKEGRAGFSLVPMPPTQVS